MATKSSAAAGLVARPSLTLKRRLNAPPAKVYAAWTNPEKIARWFGPASVKAGTEQAISAALRSVMISVEAYPDLKANTNFLELQRQLAETEDRIAAGRRYYNANVRAYNTRLESFPSSFIGNWGRFTPADYFELDDTATERQPPKVDFNGLSGGASPALAQDTGQPTDGLPPSVRQPAAQPDAIEQPRASDPNAGPPQG